MLCAEGAEAAKPSISGRGDCYAIWAPICSCNLLAIFTAISIGTSAAKSLQFTPMGSWRLNSGDFGFWILDFGFWILDLLARIDGPLIFMINMISYD